MRTDFGWPQLRSILTMLTLTLSFACLTGEIGDPCIGAECDPGCADVVCSTPPDPHCSGVTLTEYETDGICQGGVCLYQDSQRTCPENCENGACIDSACLGVICDDRPSPVCADADHLRTYAAGICELGVCIYAESLVECPSGCADKVCVGDPCSAVVCDTPPAPSCDTGLLTTHQSPGTCIAGDCSYASSDSICPHGCSANGDSCTDDPCSGVNCDTPPSPTCAGGTLTTYDSPGSCSGGDCSYTSSTTNCPSGCAASGDGCADDPCAGVNCDTPPSPTCTDWTLTTYDSPGSCSGGDCSYAYTMEFCQIACAASGDGCTDDPCAGVNCSTPPPPTCTGGVLTTYDSSGSCSDGDCSYTSSTTNCPTTCAASGDSCIGDPCAGVTCNTPPLPTCVTGALTTHNSPGTCSAGECSYTTSTETCVEGCSATGLSCISGQDWGSYTWTDATGESSVVEDCTAWLNATGQTHTGVRVIITARDTDDSVLWSYSIPGACAYNANGSCGYAAPNLQSTGGTNVSTPQAACSRNEGIAIQTQITNDATPEASAVPYEDGWVDATGQSNVNEDCLDWLARTGQGTTSRHLYDGVVIPSNWAMCASINTFEQCARGVSIAMRDSRWHESCQTTPSENFTTGLTVRTQTRQ